MYQPTNRRKSEVRLTQTRNGTETAARIEKPTRGARATCLNFNAPLHGIGSRGETQVWGKLFGLLYLALGGVFTRMREPTAPPPPLPHSNCLCKWLAGSLIVKLWPYLNELRVLESVATNGGEVSFRELSARFNANPVRKPCSFRVHAVHFYQMDVSVWAVSDCTFRGEPRATTEIKHIAEVIRHDPVSNSRESCRSQGNKQKIPLNPKIETKLFSLTYSNTPY